ncbi:hypothetical protein D9M69_618760 [compost metagenome]
MAQHHEVDVARLVHDLRKAAARSRDLLDQHIEARGHGAGQPREGGGRLGVRERRQVRGRVHELQQRAVLGREQCGAFDRAVAARRQIGDGKNGLKRRRAGCDAASGKGVLPLNLMMMHDALQSNATPDDGGAAARGGCPAVDGLR